MAEAQAALKSVEEIRAKVPRSVPLQVALGLIVVGFTLGVALGTKLVPPKIIEKRAPCPPMTEAEATRIAQASAELIRQDARLKAAEEAQGDAAD